MELVYKYTQKPKESLVGCISKQGNTQGVIILVIAQPLNLSGKFNL